MASRTGLVVVLALVAFSTTCSAFIGTGHKGFHAGAAGDHARMAARAVYEADERINIVSHDGLGSATFLAIPDDVAEPLRQRRSESIEDGIAHFTATYGAAFGITDATAKQVVQQSAEPFVDELGFVHARLRQEVEGIPVFSAGITVHFAPGYKLTSAQGIFVPGLSLTTTVPTVTEADAVDAAIATVAAEASIKPQGLKVVKAEVVVFKRALFARAEPVETDAPSGNLAYSVRLHFHMTTYFAFVDALNGQVLHIATKTLEKLKHTHVERPIPDDTDEITYSTGDDINKIENPKSKGIVENVMATYNMFASLSGGKYLSYNGKDATILSRLFIYRPCRDESECGDLLALASCRDGFCVPSYCPNAYWNSDSKRASFCPDLSTDDTVGHELAHGYMQYTGQLMGEPEPGALDEGMADIWGEVVDQLNMNTPDDKSKPGDRKFGVCVTNRNNQSVRWIQGEDDEYPSNHLGLRDMFSPQCFNHAPTTTSPLYICDARDSGGLHMNCGIVNRAFATLVDGAAFDFTKIRGLGLTKTAAIFWRAQFMYMQPFTTFTDMAFALKRACSDFLVTRTKLYEVTVKSGPWTRGNQVIGGDDCVQLFKVIDLVNMHGSRCRGPSAVRSFKIKSTTKNSITFQWMAPSTNFDASDRKSAYIIEFLMPVHGHVEWVNPTKVAGSATTYTLRGLPPRSSYTFRIRAVTMNGALYGPSSILATKTKRIPSAGIAASD